MMMCPPIDYQNEHAERIERTALSRGRFVAQKVLCEAVHDALARWRNVRARRASIASDAAGLGAGALARTEPLCERGVGGDSRELFPLIVEGVCRLPKNEAHGAADLVVASSLRVPSEAGGAGREHYVLLSQLTRRWAAHRQLLLSPHYADALGKIYSDLGGFKDLKGKLVLPFSRPHRMVFYCFILLFL